MHVNSALHLEYLKQIIHSNNSKQIIQLNNNNTASPTYQTTPTNETKCFTA